MTPEQRASHAKDMLNNPLLSEIFDNLEKGAVERCLYAQDDDTRARAAMDALAVRSFRSDCEAMLRSERAPKAAPA